ncbi:MAG: histidine phosphatase family protein, partial [Pseudomonadales bacterium]
MTTRVIIVRHGQSSYNAQQLIQGRCDESVLTEKGADDARKVGAVLSRLTLDAVYCSPLQRAKQTAEVILPYLSGSPPLQPAENLMEVDLPLWEKVAKSDARTKFPEDYRCWKERPEDFYMEISTPEGTRK